MGFFDENMLFKLRKGDHKRLFTYFKNFYINRVQHVGSVKKFSKDFHERRGAE